MSDAIRQKLCDRLLYPRPVPDERVCNAVRRVRIFHAAGLDRIQFGNGTVILPTVMRKAVVPKNIVFHERNTLSFYGICNHRRGFVRRIMRISECSLECIMIMSVEFDNIPPKCAPLCSEILKFQCFSQVSRLCM